MKTKILFSFLLLSCLAFSQTEKTKSADYLFKKYEFDKAAQQYLKLAKDDQSDYYVLKQLADCYYYVSKNDEAEKWYALALEKGVDSQTLFRYIQVLKLNGKNKEHDSQLEKYKKKYPNDLISKNYTTANSSQNYILSKLEINSDFAEFGSFYSNGTLYFTSSRNQSGKKYSWNNEPFLDIYYSKMGDNSKLSEPIALNDLNTKYNDGPSTLTADGKTIYFSTESFRENKFDKSSKDLLKYSKNMVYKANFIDNKWTSIEPLSINDIAYSTSNPCVSRDGKTLYFSSNRPGGIGGVDIWKVNLDQNGLPSGLPVNLGNKVNTEANESFPFINDDNTMLYFSSNGKEGYGAYDIYSFNIEKGDVKNLGKSVNSVKDDFSFSYSEKDKIGFLSSNRNGNDDLFMIKKECKRNIEIKVIDEKTGQLISNSELTLLDENHNLLQKLNSESNENRFVNADCNKKFELLSSKPNYEKKLTIIEPKSSDNEIITVSLKPIDVIITEKEVILKPIYFEFNKWNITSQGSQELDKLVNVMMEYPEMVIYAKSHTDSRGTDSSNLILSDKRAQSTVAYIISQGISASRISGKGFGETEPKINCDKCTEEEHSENRRSEFLIVKK